MFRVLRFLVSATYLCAWLINQLYKAIRTNYFLHNITTPHKKIYDKLFEKKMFDPNFLIISDGLDVKALDSQCRGPVFKTTGWLHGQLSLSSFQGR